MKPFEKILVPADFSRHSAAAIRYAAVLSRRFEALMTIIHVYEPASYAFPESFAFVTPEQRARLLSTFETRLQDAKAQALIAGALHVDVSLLQGVPFSEIVSFAENNAYGLIVMGTHGRTGFRHAVVGSVAEKVVRMAPCPMLTVRTRDP